MSVGRRRSVVLVKRGKERRARNRRNNYRSGDEEGGDEALIEAEPARASGRFFPVQLTLIVHYLLNGPCSSAATAAIANDHDNCFFSLSLSSNCFCFAR